MRFRLPGDSPETSAHRGERPARKPRPSREEEEPEEAGDEWTETPRRETPRRRRTELEIDEGALDSPPTTYTPWLPPARR
jgi:hypothetical protein